MGVGVFNQEMLDADLYHSLSAIGIAGKTVNSGGQTPYVLAVAESDQKAKPDSVCGF